MTDWVFVIILLGVALFFVAIITFNQFVLSLVDEAKAEIDENFKCNESYILYLEAEYQAVKEHIVMKVFKECLT